MIRRYFAAQFLLTLLMGSVLVLSPVAQSQTAAGPQTPNEIEHSFKAFLEDYWRQIRSHNTAYLKSVHPKLPENMYDFFFDVTLQIMQFSEENSLKRVFECQDFNVCKVVYSQPNDSWAAQRFILHENSWHWLDQ